MKNRSVNIGDAVQGCPDWCELAETGHSFSEVSGEGYPMRHHNIVLFDSQGVLLELTQPEVVKPTGAELVDEICVSIDGKCRLMDGAGVIRFAEAVRTAADKIAAEAGR